MVRRVRKSDEHAVARLWIALLEQQSGIDPRFGPSEDAKVRWHNDFRGWLESEARRMMVAEDDGVVCGFVTAERWVPPPIYQDSPGIFVNEIYVDPGFRRRGHGTALIQAIREWAEGIGAFQVRAGVLSGNEVGLAFWKNVGGKPIAVSVAIPLSEEVEEKPPSGRLGFQL